MTSHQLSTYVMFGTKYDELIYLGRFSEIFTVHVTIILDLKSACFECQIVCLRLWIQLVAATHALNLSAGV